WPVVSMAPVQLPPSRQPPALGQLAMAPARDHAAEAGRPANQPATRSLESRTTSRRDFTGVPAVRDQAISALGGAGQPLPLPVRRHAEARWGQDFGEVRVHQDASTAAAARALRASAFTVGTDIGFAAGRYAPASGRGQALLQHELTHVAQQRSASRTPTPALDVPSSATERQARDPDREAPTALPVQRIQCAPEDEQYSLGTGVLDSVGHAAFGDSAWPFMKAVFEGAVGGLQADVKAGRAEQAKGHLSKLLVPWNAAKFYGGYLIGLGIGLVSPITDLVKGMIGLVKLGASAVGWLAKWSPVGIAISPQRQQKIVALGQKFDELSAQLGDSLITFIADPAGTMKKVSGFFDNLMQLALGKARQLGAQAAHAVFDFLQKPFYEMGKGIGEVIGALVAQVLLLVFSDAIGNLITKGASFIGKAAEFVAGKAVQFFNWAKGLASEVMGLLRNAVKGALKIFEGLTNKAIEAFDALMAIFVDSEGLLAEGERVAAGVGKGAPGKATNIMESRMVTGTRTSPATVSDLTPPKVHPSKAGPAGTGEPPKPLAQKEIRQPSSTQQAVDDLERNRGGTVAGEDAAIGTGIESIEVQNWAAELDAKGFRSYPRNQFGEAKLGNKRISSMFTDQRARPDMIAINDASQTILVGDITASPASTAAIPGRIGEEGLHIEKTIEYAKQLQRQLPPGYEKWKVVAQDRHWKTGGATKQILIK
ncbi:MAG: DUF4157 domain-containing protein, partial [Jatrophihabitantaceae bacterium]